MPNLITEADSLEEVMSNVSDALSAIIEAYQELPYSSFQINKPHCA